ncbi:MAG TPA: FtsW/RodA/SpoVE family cell cycle protein [Thermoanaerobaculia bacterium]|nr:FtsW/RodA/SpoVE family cell cycle protein [Thermoanaerobaculia bacterium]
MAVTRSTAADRRRQAASPLDRGMVVPGLAGGPVRNREAVLLAAGALVVLLALVLVYLATAKPLDGVDQKIAAGEIVNLNALRGSEQLLPVLDVLDSSAERSFVAQEIWKRAHLGKLPNVGEISRIRVPASEIERDRRLTSFRERLDAARRRASPEDAGNVSIPLLTLRELRDIKPRLVVRTPGQFRSSFWLWSAVFLLAFALPHVVWRVRRFGGDELVLPALLVLAGIGLAVMVSVRDPLRDLPIFRTFVQGVFGGSLLMIAGSLVDWERSPMRRRSFAPLFGAFGLSVVLILFGSGPGGSDAKVNLFGFQPVEAIKILVVLFLAGYFFDRWEFLRELPETRAALPGLLRKLGIPKLEYLLPPLLAIGLVLVFFFLQRDLGPALILSFLFLVLYCVALGKPWMALAGTAVIVAAFAVGYKLGVPHTVSGRLSMWLSPWDNGFRGGDHLAQGLWALAGGALTGTGLGLGQPQRVPEVHTDLVLAGVGEELGFLGLLVVLVLYALLVWRGFRAAFRAGGIYSFFLALGLTVLIALQTLLIAGGVLGVLPLSGVVSPFLSSGRTAMLANFLILGMLLAISAHSSDPSGDSAATRRFHGAARWTAAVLGLVLAAIVLRAAQVQVLQPDRFLTRGALTVQADGYRRFLYNPRLVDIARSIPRGNIVDRNGVLLATSDPAELVKRRAVLDRLGATLDPPDRPRRGDRYYPFEGVTFHLLGDLNNRVNWGATNTSYTERDSRIRLQGYDDFAGVVEVLQPNGEISREIQLDYSELVPLLRHRWQPEHAEVKKIRDRDRTVRTTIDVRLQKRAAEILEKYARPEGHGAAAVVLDAATGDLLASVSYPWPKRLPMAMTEEEGEDATPNLIDRARYGIYPPGSTFKIVTAMAALRKDPDVPRRTFLCKTLPGGRVGNFVRGWSRPVRDDPTDHAPHGDANLERGIVVSCNAYFAQLGTYMVGPEALLETARALGISVANPSTAEQLKDALPQASYGQGQVVATPFQMARVAATVANRGAMPEGRWILDESNTRRAEPVRILDGGLVPILTRSMRRVVTEGTAARFLSGVQPAIAGKTGTAEVKDKRSHSWFIGFAPYEAAGGRRIAFGVVVEHGGYGGRLAAPAAGEIVKEAAGLGLIHQP